VTVNQFGTYEFAWTTVNSICQSTDIVTVIFNDLPLVSAGRDTIICEDGNAQLEASGTGTFEWLPVSSLDNSSLSNPLASPDTTTIFTVTLTDQNGCENSDEVKVEVWKKPVADAGSDQVLEYLFSTSLDAGSVESGTGTWSLLSGDGDILDENAASSDITGLSLGNNYFRWTVTNGVCPAVSDDVIITVIDLVIPSLITPDHSDNYNEYFVIRGIETLGKTSLVIFDRKGLKVYESKNYENDWNGVDYNDRDLPEDTYFYVIKSENGKSLSGFIVIRR
jgi:gliding motility-associated-like protein